MISITETVLKNNKKVAKSDIKYISDLINKIALIKTSIEDSVIKRDACIAEYVTKLDTLVSNIKQSLVKSSTSSASKPTLDFDKFESEKEVHDDIITSMQETLKDLEKQLQIGLSTPSLQKIKKEISEHIFSSPFMKSTECSICFSVGIMVDVKLPCREINPRTGRPFCEGIMCLTCARHILGLSLDRQQYHQVKCPTCRETSRRPAKAAEGYAINMALMRAVDNYLTYENEIFIKYFEHSLKLIECQKCDANFCTLSDLHHHMRGDPSHIPCPGASVPCIQCKRLNIRKTLTNGLCEFCNIHNNPPDTWDEPTPHEIPPNVWDNPAPIANDNGHWRQLPPRPNGPPPPAPITDDRW